MSKRNVFLRLWDYLRQYKGALFLAVFLKIFSSVMSVLEPFVLGLAITELTSNLMDMAHGVAGAHLNISYIAIILVLYFVRGMGYGLSSYGSNFFITKAVQKTIHDLRRDLSEKLIRFQFLTSTVSNLGTSWDVLHQMLKQCQMRFNKVSFVSSKHLRPLHWLFAWCFI